MKKVFTLLMALVAIAGTARADVEWTIWEGSATETNVQLNPVDFTNLEVGDILYVYGTGTLSKAFYTIEDDAWYWTTVTSNFTPTDAGTDANYYFVANQALLDTLAQSKLHRFVVGNWDTGTITKVSIKKKTSMIKNVLSSEAKEIGNWAASYTIESSAMPTVAEGDYLYLAATAPATVIDTYDMKSNATPYTDNAALSEEGTITFSADNSKYGWAINGTWLNKTGSSTATATVTFSSAISASVQLVAEYKYTDNEVETTTTVSSTAESGSTTVSVTIPATSTYVTYIYLQGSNSQTVGLSDAKVSYTNDDPYRQIQFSYGEGWTSLYSVNSFSHDNWKKVASSSDAITLKSNDFHVNGTFYDATGLYLYHPVSSFAIGDIGYATFSASQQVTAPASVTAYKGTISGDKLVLTPFTNNVIPANTGAIIAGDEGAVLEFTASSESTSETSDLIACTTATTISSLESGYDYYILYNNPTGGNTYFGLDDSDLNTKWGDGTTYSSKVITFTESWKGCGWYLTADYSNYSKVVVEFESATTSGGRLVVDYDNNNTSYTDFTTGATSVEVAFDEEKKNSVKQIYFTSETASATFTLSSAYIVSNAGSQKAEFRKTTSGTLAANKAYLKIAQGSPARLSIAFEDDVPTGISTVEKSVKCDDRLYNLNGQVVKRAGKGLYIKNGKKYLIK